MLLSTIEEFELYFALPQIPPAALLSIEEFEHALNMSSRGDEDKVTIDHKFEPYFT